MGAHVIILRHLRSLEVEEDAGSSASLGSDLMDELGAELQERWVHRQTYASLCFRIFSADIMEPEQFAQEILPYLVEMAWDKVPNVRLVVARSLYTINLATYYSDNDFANSERFREAISVLSSDPDNDVKAFFNPVPPATAEFYDSDGDPIVDVSSLPV